MNSEVEQCLQDMKESIFHLDDVLCCLPLDPKTYASMETLLINIDKKINKLVEMFDNEERKETQD